MEVVRIIIAAAVAGFIIGLTFGYIAGHTRGYNQANEWYESELKEQ